MPFAPPRLSRTAPVFWLVGAGVLVLFGGLTASVLWPEAKSSPARDSRVYSLSDLAALRALVPTAVDEPVQASVAGYRAPGDGGGGLFEWSPSSGTPPDDVLVVQPTGSSQGRWIREWSGDRLSPEMAGARGDGVSDDSAAFARLVALSSLRGAFTITLAARRRYFLADTLDLAVGAPGLAIEGPASPLSHTETWIKDAFGARIELAAASGARIRLGTGQTLQNVLVWRHGLSEAPGSLDEVRRAVDTWFAEDGTRSPRSIGVELPYDDASVAGCAVIGFHTGMLATGSRVKLRHDYIDAAGYAVEVAGGRDTSLIEDIQTRALWSNAVEGSDPYGDAGYRPGTAFYIHDGADGLQINSVMAIGWVNGIWLAGTRRGEDWLISLLQPDIETTANAGRMTAAIKTTGSVRRLTIVDPRIVTGAPGAGPTAALDFGHTDPAPVAAANNNVTVIGGTLEVAGTTGSAVVMRAGSTGSIIGTTMALTDGNASGPLVSVEAGSGRWALVAPRLSGVTGRRWIRIDPGAADRISIEGVFPDPASPVAGTIHSHVLERRWLAWDSSVATTDGSPQAVATVETLAEGAGQVPLVSYRRRGTELARIVAGGNWITMVMPHLPTSPSGLPRGALWNSNGALNIVP